MKIPFAALSLALALSHAALLGAEISGDAGPYVAAPLDNPLRGLVPYQDEEARAFPHSMEFTYIPFAKLVKGPGEYDWAPLEKALEAARARGNQLIFRISIEYPGEKTELPEFLKARGVGLTEWATEEDGKGAVGTPDWEHPALREAITGFIAAMGQKYDGDPRIGFITAGLLGLWGEWHDYPREELFASRAVQREVLDAYEKAFQKTKILLRYPAGELGEGGETGELEPNAHRPFGYHDDSFGWATLDTGREDDSWYFLAAMKAAGALGKWQTQPIGGEIRPELWAGNFTAKLHPSGQDFPACIAQSHVSWLMDSGMFSEAAEGNPAQIARARVVTAAMGYELHISGWKISASRVLSLTVENRGVAPFYYDWPIELEVDGKSQACPEWRLSQILPDAPVEWTCQLDQVPGTLRIRIPHPMAGGKALRLANPSREGGWVVLRE